MDEKKYFKLSKELSEIYLEIKAILLLSEDEDINQRIILTCINELRNAFDHTMKTFSEGESLEENFKKAVGHLYRAGFDAYEVISISIIKHIQDIRKNFSFEAIVTAYPDYYKKILPTIEKIKRAKVRARSNKTVKDNVSPEEHFKEYEKIVKDIIILKEEMDLHITGIKDAQISIR
ncbi:unnamed protein product, partial [marine sediment metagenome]